VMASHRRHSFYASCPAARQFSHLSFITREWRRNGAVLETSSCRFSQYPCNILECGLTCLLPRVPERASSAYQQSLDAKNTKAIGLALFKHQAACGHIRKLRRRGASAGYIFFVDCQPVVELPFSLTPTGIIVAWEITTSAVTLDGVNSILHRRCVHTHCNLCH
jgi:hypothetical protein